MRRERGWPIALALLSGLLLFSAFPPLELHLLAWVALVPLLVASRDRGAAASFGLGLVTGLVSFRGIFYWINRDQGVTWPDALALNAYLALYVGVFAMALTVVSRRAAVPVIVAAPALWVGVEYVRGHVDFLSLPWGFLAHSQYRNISLIQLVSVTGVWGVSALVVMVNVAVADLIPAWVNGRWVREGARRTAVPIRGHPRRQHWAVLQASVAGALVAIIAVAGAATVPGARGIVRSAGATPPPASTVAGAPSTAARARAIVAVPPTAAGANVAGAALPGDTQRAAPDHVHVTVVQGNIPQRERWVPGLIRRNVEQHIALSRGAIAHVATESRRPALIVWPETAVPRDAMRDIGLAGALMAVSRDTGLPLLVGSALRPKFGPPEARREKLVNSAMLFSPGGQVVKQYDKVRLVPFGEYLPHADMLPWPDRIRASAGRFVPGRERTLFEVDGARFATVICWEVIFPEIVRQVVTAGAGFVVNLTNEAWFGDTAAPYQFQAIAVFRAVENRVAIVRAANTGISGFIDPYGRITGTVSQGGRETFVAGTLTRDVPITRGGTLYTRFGDILAHAALAVSAVALVTAGWRRRVPE